MRYRFAVATSLVLVIAQSQAFLRAQGQPLPVKGGRAVVATVNGEAISLDELSLQLGPSADRARMRQGRGTAKEVDLLDRLITTKLIVQEATTMGLHEIPEIRKQIEVSSREILREVLIERLVKGVEPDPAAVEELFRNLVREWRTTSLLFQNEAAARRAHKEITGGSPFTQVAAKAVAAKSARADVDDKFHPKREYLPQIAEAIAPLTVGQVSPVIRLQSGFVVVKVVAMRYPPNAGARAEARKNALSQKQLTVLKAHEQAMRRQYVAVNAAVLKGLDYAAPQPGVNALLKDKRVVATIKGATPVTVGDLTDYLRMQFFHGTDETKQRKEMNAKKEVALDATLGRRLLNMEAARLGIDKTNAYRDRVNGYRESLIFDSFIQKVIVPENKMKDEEVKGYYSGHVKEYSYPEMVKVRSLAFTRRNAAENAMRKLREGADYGWMLANAEGQADKGTQGLVTFDGRPVTTSSMPDGVQKALAGVKSGEYRLYPGPEGNFYVLAVQQVISANLKPYDEVREEIARKLYAEKLKKSVEVYSGKLRAHSKVQTYLKRMR